MAEVRPGSPYDFDRRLAAVEEFRKRPEANNLQQANKRVKKILKDIPLDKLDQEIDKGLLESGIEEELFHKLEATHSQVADYVSKKAYTDALLSLVELKEPIDGYFDNVRVNADDEGLKLNRQRLLKRVERLLTQVADISLLQ